MSGVSPMASRSNSAVGPDGEVLPVGRLSLGLARKSRDGRERDALGSVTEDVEGR